MNTRRIFTFLLIAAVCLMSAGVGAADVLTVGNSGSEMYASIQDAIDEANEGDTIEVFSGTYYENVNVNKQLTLRGIGMPVVDAGGIGSAITLSNEGIILEGFTATGSGPNPEAGIKVFRSSNTLISNIASNNSNYGIYLSSSSNNNTLSGNTASNNSEYGIYLSSSSNNTLISNTASNNSEYGISLFSSSNNKLRNNIVFNDNQIGIRLSSSSNNNTLSGNIVSNNSGGISLHLSSNNTISDNTASNNTWGIKLSFSSNNTLSGNIASNNSGGINLFDSSSNNMLISNTVSNNSEYGISLFSSNNNNTLSGNMASNNKYGIYLYSSNNNTLSGNMVSYNREGISVSFSSNNNTLSGNIVSYGSLGIRLAAESSNNTLISNTVFNTSSGIVIGYSSNNMLIGNTASNTSCGIYLYSSNNNILNSNTASNNDKGIRLIESSNNILNSNTASDNSNNGIYLFNSSNNTLSSNMVSNNDDCIILYSSNNNTLSGNMVSYNKYGISLHLSSNNNIYQNNFILNFFYNAMDDSNNQWDSGAEGNYYSNYLGTDSDGDGIGDTSYLIPGGSSVDRYPLMGPYSPTTPSEIQDKNLYQVEGQTGVYWFQNNKLYGVMDNVIEGMSGIPGWDSVNTLPASEFDPADYDQEPRFITTGTISDGLLIREVEDYKVYLVENGMKRHITYPDVMDLKGYSFDDVIEVSSVISDMFQFGDPIGIEVDLYFNKITNSGDISHVSQFISEETVKSITETTVVEDYTVNTYVKVIFPDNTEKYAYYVNSNPQPTDSLQFSDSKISLYPDTWVAQTNTWNWNEYTFAGDEMEGIYTWEFWYEDVASGKILGMDVQGYEFTNTIIIPSATPVESSTGEGTVYFDVGTSTIEDLIAENVGDYPDAPVEANLKYGLFSFNIIDLVDGSATLTFEFPDNLPAGTTYWKYGPTPADSTPHWYSIPSIINGNKLTITLTDGGLGDDDLAINGIIADPGGPSIPLITAPIPEFPTIALPVLSVIGLMLLFGRRRDNL